MANELDLNALAKAIADGITATQPTKDVSFEDYIKRPGVMEPKLKRPVFQHGHPIQIKGCSQDTIKHLDELQPGDYFGGLVKVTLRGYEPDVELHIDYPCATIDERMKVYSHVTSFSDMVQKMAKEQKAAGK